MFYKNDVELENCKFYGYTCCKRTLDGKMVLITTMCYLPIIHRLNRLYALMSFSPHINGTLKNKRPPSVLSHPSNRKDLKNFDRTYPNFTNEPRNFSLGLCVDGFAQFSNFGTPYSC